MAPSAELLPGNLDLVILKAISLGPLHGLPVAHKDLVPTAGIRTTYGSPLYKDNVPTKDALIVTRIRAAGAITLGKTNTPEFGAGSNTFNPVFGATHNAYNLAKTVGGSSGGAAAALTTCMVPIADGSDTGGSLRNPAAFNNVVGFRPSPGRVTDYHAPGGLGVRVDSALYHGYEVPPYYDSLISKLIVHGRSRNECLMRLQRALEEYVIGGIETTIPLHQRLATAVEFIDGDYDVHWLERFVREQA